MNNQIQRRPLPGLDTPLRSAKNSEAIICDVGLAERTCVRCGCTEHDACTIGEDIPGFPVIACEWACEGIDLCSACVRPDEVATLDDLKRLEQSLNYLLTISNEWVTMFRQRFAAQARDAKAARPAKKGARR